MILDEICYLVILFCRSYYTYGCSSPVFSLRRVPWSIYEYFRPVTTIAVLCATPSCFAANGKLVITYPQDSRPFLWRGCIDTLVQWPLTSRFTLRCHGRRARPSPEGTGPVSQDAYVMLGGITMGKSRRIMSEALDKAFDKHLDKSEKTDQRLVGLQHGAQQPRLDMEADVKSDTKTRKRAKDAAADRTKHGDSCSAKKIQAGPTSSTHFGLKAEPPALPRRDDVLADKGAATPKPCPSPVEMRILTAAGGLLPASTASTATRIIFYRLPLRFYPTEATNSGATSIQYATHNDFWKMKVLKTKSSQTLVFDPGGSTGRLRTYPFWGAWRALLCGEVSVWVPDGTQS